MKRRDTHRKGYRSHDFTEAEDARMEREGRSQGMSTLGSMLPTLMEGGRRRQDAYGTMLGELFGAQPLVMGAGKRTQRIPNSRPSGGV